MVVIGGKFTLTTVSLYGKVGWWADIPAELNTGRQNHGCAGFLSKDNRYVRLSFNLDGHSINTIIFQMVLVSGGYDDSLEPLASTEVIFSM